MTPLAIASYYNNPDLVALLLAAGASLDYGAQAVSRAAAGGAFEALTTLMLAGASVEGKNRLTQRSVLSEAVCSGCAELVDLLLKRGIPVDDTVSLHDVLDLPDRYVVRNIARLLIAATSSGSDARRLLLSSRRPHDHVRDVPDGRTLLEVLVHSSRYDDIETSDFVAELVAAGFSLASGEKL
jgi:ankyrin repeat protein